MFVSIAERFRVARALVFLALIFASLAARAQQMDAAKGSTITPPRLKTDSGAEYPAQALHDQVPASVTVTLILEISTDGAVAKADLQTPQGHGFDEAALAAAHKLVFEPALRDGTPISARIKFQYVFTPPAPRLVGRVARQVSDRPIAGAQVKVRDASGGEHTTSTAPDGSWGFLDLPPGHVHILVSAAGQMPVDSEEDLASGQETSLTLRLSPELASTPVAESAPGAEAPVEIEVRGERPPREVTKRTLGKEEIEHIPGTNGDALRSLQNLPGVARPPPFQGALIVRGSAPADTNIFVDGTNIPLIYHFGGLSSVVPTELLEKIDFYPGNFSAVYGRGMGGVVDVGLRDPRSDGLHGLAQVDLIDARLMLEGPVFKTGWKFLVAGRRSYFDAWLGPALKRTGAGVTTAPRYYDGQAMLQRDIDSHSSFRLTLLGSNDALKILNQTPDSADPTFAGQLGYSTSFWRLQARYQNKLSARTELRVTAAYGVDAIDLGVGTNLIRTTLHPVSARAELSHKVVRGLSANFGVDLVYEPYHVSLSVPPTVRPGQPSGGPGQVPVRVTTSETLFLPAGYAELEVVPWRGGRIVPGLRADYDSSTSSWDFSPRVNGRQDLTTGFPRTTLKAGAGLFYQPPAPIGTSQGAIDTGTQTMLSSNRAIHYDVGLEQEFTANIDLSFDLFYKSLNHLVVSDAGNSGDGRAYGAEWLLRYKPGGRFFGWVSYTLSRSERRDTPAEPLRLSEYDQTHILTLIGSYKLGRGWQLGGRFRLVSGNLYSPTSYGAFDATTGSQLGVATFPPNGSRLPYFHQLDIRADKTWLFPSWKLNAYLDVQNVYYAKNAEGIGYNYNYTQYGYVTGLPILPSLGLRAEF